MRPYLRILGLVLLVYGGGGMLGVFKHAHATHAMDWGLFFQDGTVFMIIAAIGVGLNIKASMNAREDRARAARGDAAKRNPN